MLVSVWKGRSFLQPKTVISLQLCPRTELQVTILRFALVLPHSTPPSLFYLVVLSSRSMFMDQQSPHAVVESSLFKNISELELPRNLRSGQFYLWKAKFSLFTRCSPEYFIYHSGVCSNCFPLLSIFFSIWHMWPKPWCKYCGIAYLHEYTLSHSLLKITGSILDAKNSWK